MESVRSLVLHGPGRLLVERHPAPHRGSPSEALVRVLRGGLCGTDLHYWRHGRAGLSVMTKPMRLGHELSGIVQEAAADGSSPPEGALVAIHPILSRPPADGSSKPVPGHLDPGSRYLGSAAAPNQTDGGFSDLLVLPSAMVRAVPSGVSANAAALAEPLSVAWHAVDRARLEPEDDVLVVGAGVIGILVASLAGSVGCRVVAVDVSAPALALARACGIAEAVTPDKMPEGWRPDVAIECSGSAAGVRSACTVGYRGRVMLVGLHPAGDIALPLSELMRREITLTAAFRFDSEMDRALTSLADGSIPADALVDRIFPMERADEAFERLSDPAQAGKVLLSFDSAC